jgi:acyl carrier protein
MAFSVDARSALGGQGRTVAAMSTLTALQEILVREYAIPLERLMPDALLSSLGVDSLGMLELMFKIEDRFNLKIPGDPPTDLATVADVVAYVDSLITGEPGPRGP